MMRLVKSVNDVYNHVYLHIKFVYSCNTLLALKIKSLTIQSSLTKL